MISTDIRAFRNTFSKKRGVFDFALYEKCRRVLKSCKTIEQAEVSHKFVLLAIPKILGIPYNEVTKHNDYILFPNELTEQLMRQSRLQCRGRRGITND